MTIGPDFGVGRYDMVKRLADILGFIFYYTKLLITVSLGLHETSHPLSMRWRWHLWQQRQEIRRQHK